MPAFALILAAGFSSRMAPHFKPLLELPFPGGPATALARLCALYRSEGVEPLVVGGHRFEETKEAAQACEARFALNPKPEQGMLSSVKAGLCALPEDCTAFFVHPVDVPLVRRMTIRLVLEATKQSHAKIFIPSFQGKAGHPPLIRGELRQILLEKDSADGLRGLLREYGGKAQTVATADSFILKDMDNAEAYRTLCGLAPTLDCLAPQEAAALLELLDVPPKGMAHARAVAALASAFTDALNEAKNAGLDRRLARSGALLHDMCKGQPKHEEAAGRLLRGWGLERMARLVEDHRDIDLPPDMPLTERELIFLADKYVYGSRPVSLEQRFEQKLELYADSTEACEAIRARRGRAIAMARRFAEESGTAPETTASDVLAPALSDVGDMGLPVKMCEYS